MTKETVNHPDHYNSHPARCECGKPIECIQIAEHMGFNLGNSLKYMWRADFKGAATEDLNKAIWYLEREIFKRQRDAEQTAKADVAKSLDAAYQKGLAVAYEQVNQPLGMLNNVFARPRDAGLSTDDI